MYRTLKTTQARFLTLCTIFVLPMLASCAYFGGDQPGPDAREPEAIGSNKIINVAVYDERSKRTHRALTSRVLIQSLRETLGDVLRNLGFTVRRHYQSEGYSMIVTITQSEFKTTTAFGTVRLIVGTTVFCRSPYNKYGTRVTLRKKVPPDKVEEARENPQDIIEEQYESARRDLVRKIFNQQPVRQCISETGAPRNPFQS